MGKRMHVSERTNNRVSKTLFFVFSLSLFSSVFLITSAGVFAAFRIADQLPDLDFDLELEIRGEGSAVEPAPQQRLAQLVHPSGRTKPRRGPSNTQKQKKERKRWIEDNETKAGGCDMWENVGNTKRWE